MIQNFAKDHLRQIVMRIERMEEEKRALADDVKQTYAEAKGHGYYFHLCRNFQQFLNTLYDWGIISKKEAGI